MSGRGDLVLGSTSNGGMLLGQGAAEAHAAIYGGRGDRSVAEAVQEVRTAAARGTLDRFPGADGPIPVDQGNPGRGRGRSARPQRSTNGGASAFDGFDPNGMGGE